MLSEVRLFEEKNSQLLALLQSQTPSDRRLAPADVYTTVGLSDTLSSLGARSFLPFSLLQSLPRSSTRSTRGLLSEAGEKSESLTIKDLSSTITGGGKGGFHYQGGHVNPANEFKERVDFRAGNCEGHRGQGTQTRKPTYWQTGEGDNR